jgi:DNA-binding Xre family transcriptional regulator
MNWKRKLRDHPKNQAMEEVGISKHKEHFLSNGKVTEISDPAKTKQQQVSQA